MCKSVEVTGSSTGTESARRSTVSREAGADPYGSYLEGMAVWERQGEESQGGILLREDSSLGAQKWDIPRPRRTVDAPGTWGPSPDLQGRGGLRDPEKMRENPTLPSSGMLGDGRVRVPSIAASLEGSCHFTVPKSGKHWTHPCPGT